MFFASGALLSRVSYSRPLRAILILAFSAPTFFLNLLPSPQFHRRERTALDRESDRRRRFTEIEWPDFDRKFGMVRIEYHCAKCGVHHGHVFNDGPTTTGKRFCNNGLCLIFKPSKD